MSATIIIPQYGQSELTCACISSIRRFEARGWPILVVDDGSDPCHVERVRNAGFAETRVIAQAHRGVTSAWARGLAESTSAFVLFVNNDVTWRGPIVEQLLEPLVEGVVLATGVRWRREACLPRSTLSRLPADEFLEGWCWASSRASIDLVGGFDESLALYWSDTDMQARLMRLWAERGGSAKSASTTFDVRRGLCAVANLPIAHAGHQTSRRLPNRRTIWERDRAAFIAKWNANVVAELAKSSDESPATSATSRPLAGASGWCNACLK